MLVKPQEVKGTYRHQSCLLALWWCWQVRLFSLSAVDLHLTIHITDLLLLFYHRSFLFFHRLSFPYCVGLAPLPPYLCDLHLAFMGCAAIRVWPATHALLVECLMCSASLRCLTSHLQPARIFSHITHVLSARYTCLLFRRERVAPHKHQLPSRSYQ